jgi:hypothetical protein
MIAESLGSQGENQTEDGALRGSPSCGLSTICRDVGTESERMEETSKCTSPHRVGVVLRI